MIKFVTGKPGGGKSLRTMQLMLTYLIETDKVLVTNIPLVFDNLQEYLLSRGKEINVYERVVLLRKEEFSDRIKETEYKAALKRFFLYRTTDLQACPPPLVDDKGNYQEELELPQNTFGRVFFIDEIHKLWPAREFQKSDKLIFEYLAEHRHFSDDVVFVTQALAQVDKQIRLLGQDFEVIRNRGKEKYSVFAGPQVFTRYVFLSAPGGNNQVPSEKTTFRLDKAQASCYQTSAKGGEGDKGQKAKGIPFHFIFVGLILAFLGIYKALDIVPKMLFGLDKKEEPQIAQALPGELVTLRTEERSSTPVINPDEPDLPKVLGMYILQNGTGKVWLDDGSTLSARAIQAVRSNGIEVGGQLLLFATPTIYEPEQQKAYSRNRSN